MNDAERLCVDPAMRAVVGGRATHATAASTSEMARFKIETLSTRENLKHLIDLPVKSVRAARPRPPNSPPSGEVDAATDDAAVLRAFRRFRQRHTLRIAINDVIRHSNIFGYSE